MSKFTFIKEDGTYCINSKQTVEFSTVSLEEVLKQFETFLRGAGFEFEGKVNIDSGEDDSGEDYQSNYDFTNLPHNSWPFAFAKTETPGVCPVCKIDNKIMSMHKCYDNKCPREVINAN
jgi:hypothetical protein